MDKVTPKVLRIIRFTSWIVAAAIALLARQLCLHFGMSNKDAGEFTAIVFFALFILILVATRCFPAFQRNATKPDGSSYTNKDKIVALAIIIITILLMALVWWVLRE